jgi:hypothetical protein
MASIIAKCGCKVDEFVVNIETWQEEKTMGKRIKHWNGIFIVIVLGLAAIFITLAGPAFGSMASASTSPAASALSPSPKAAGPCGDKSMRYADCGNGTVTDTVTGLIWLKDPNCLPSATWDDAKKAVAGLKDGACMLKDGSAPGDWRLPTDKEWEATMAPAKSKSCSYPTLTDDLGTGCIKTGKSSFAGLESDYYWSNTPNEGTGRVFVGDLDHGNILSVDAPNAQRVWPVRGAQR